MIKTLYPVFIWVMDSSIKVSVLIAIVLIIRALLKGKAEAKFYYILWIIVILRIIIPDLYKSDLSFLRYASAVKYVNKNSTIVENNNKNISSETIEENSQVVSEHNNDTNNIFYSNKTNIPFDLRYMFFIIWIIGLFINIITTLIINLSFLRKISRGTIIKQFSILELFNKCKKEMGISEDILLIETHDVKTVGLLGNFRPEILFPVNFINKLNEDNLRYVFLHELSHLKHRDILINYIISILTAFHWFNPIVWYGFYKMREDCELCCDSNVIRHLKNDEAVKYGYTIIKLAENLSIRKHMLITAPIVRNKAQIKRRIRMIGLFNKKVHKLSFFTILVIALVAIIAFTGVGCNIKDNESKNSINSSYKAIVGNKESISTANDFEIIVYTTHSNELYKHGMSAMEVGKKLTKGLEEQGFKCTFLEVPMDTKRDIAYEVSRGLIEKNVKDYDKKVLLDIHIDYGLFNLDYPIPQELKTQEGMKIILGKRNCNYKENYRFAEVLLNELKGEKATNPQIILNEGGKYNQDLSSKSLGIEMGTSNFTREEVEYNINALTMSLKKIIPELK